MTADPHSHYPHLLLFANFRVGMEDPSADPEAAEDEQSAPQANRGPNTKITFPESHEGGKKHHGVSAKVMGLQPVEVEEIAEEFEDEEPEAAAEVGDEDDPLVVPGHGRKLRAGD